MFPNSLDSSAQFKPTIFLVARLTSRALGFESICSGLFARSRPSGRSMPLSFPRRLCGTLYQDFTPSSLDLSIFLKVPILSEGASGKHRSSVRWETAKKRCSWKSASETTRSLSPSKAKWQTWIRSKSRCLEDGLRAGGRLLLPPAQRYVQLGPFRCVWSCALRVALRCAALRQTHTVLRAVSSRQREGLSSAAALSWEFTGNHFWWMSLSSFSVKRKDVHPSNHKLQCFIRTLYSIYSIKTFGLCLRVFFTSTDGRFCPFFFAKIAQVHKWMLTFFFKGFVFL